MSNHDAQLRALVAEGKSLREIREILGMTRSGVYRALKRLGLSVQHQRGGSRKGAGRPPRLSEGQTRDLVSRAAQEQWGQRQTAAYAGVSVVCLRDSLSRYRVEWWR